MARTEDADTLALEVFRQLRADIVSGRFEPGTRVSPAEIRGRFAVSTGVVREALTRLEVHGLLRAEPNRGYYVPSLSVGDLQHLVETRVLNETAALRESIRYGDVEWESSLVAAHHRMLRLTGTSGPHQRSNLRVDAHLDFHLRLLGGCRNPYLIQICTRLQDAAELYRGWATGSAAGGDRDLAREHLDILHAALARDEGLAVSRYESHVRQTAAAAIEEAGREAGPSDDIADARPRYPRRLPS